MGDFNFNLNIDSVSNDKNQFLALVNSLNLHILPLNPTYHRPDSDSWLDLILTNDLNRIKCHGQLSVSGISYHDLIYVEFNLKAKLFKDKEYLVVRSFKNINLAELKAQCNDLQWDNLCLTDSLDEKVEILENNIISVYDKYVPERKVLKRKNPCPWINADLKSVMKERDLLYRRYVKNKNEFNWEQYRVLRNRVKRMLRDARNNYIAQFLQEN